MNKLSPSVLAADFTKLGEQIKAVESAGTQMIHIDVMDGMFVPSISFGMPIVSAIRSCTDLVLDVHLMIEEPIRYVDEFASCGADLLTVHVEACQDLEQTIKKIHEKGMKAGVSCNPNTPVERIADVLPLVDLVLIMTVNPGFGGQKLIPETIEKVREIRQMLDAQNLKADLEVDGGINLENAKTLLDAGANVLVAGSAVFGGDANQRAEEFLRILRLQ